MDVEDGQSRPPMEGWQKSSPKGEEKPPKRKMKSPYQLEILEGTYAAEMYPSETLRAELSVKTGLSDRQLQMWFCHRRLKDRKHAQGKRGKKEEEEALAVPAPAIEMKAAPRSSSLGPSSVPFPGDGGEPRKAVARIGPEVLPEKRYYELPFFPPQPPQLSMLELRIIASVEAQLGESLREDGPVLGFEFDPLPPGAFGEPIESDMRIHSTYGRASFQFLDRPESSGLSLQAKQLVRPYDAKSLKTSEVFPGMDHSIFPSSSGQKRKATFNEAHAIHSQLPPRALQEYQFLPEQPSRSDLYERVPQSHFYDSPVATPSSRVPSFPTGSQYVHANDQMAPTYTFQGQVSSSVLPQSAREHFHGNSHDGVSNVSPFGNSAADSQIVIHQAMGLEHTFLSSEGRIIQDDLNKTERKLKSEARIAKEVEAHEKKIRRELEKQDVLRRKREEQMRREMDRVDNERRKEEERMLREKQREEERFLREQKRENERKEKILLKESLRAEKLRQKEEKQREKEAARIKAANERATARRISREYMELIEDERLELMELAALSKGLPSVISLDNDTLAQLDPFRDQLNAFPPKSVKLKRPFSFQPWIQSEENVGNLLMVWMFLITFIDALGLWSFTLDEFLQALHDYDSRLLGEIHVALLKIIIRDIEDVARTPANALRANHTAANPGGGHSQIVEGAYAWGFSISSWQRHLNFLTWPEILRQFALSAGFGPQLKKRHVERTYFRDDNEVDDREDIVSTLRNGAAAETAAALMQTKNYNHRRGCRHRLTPGTVKFAAFHVLSLEGSKGLTILEVAEKIQKSGLRDLTTSKTPEASIAAALSRDADLFERIAPSTYCVRPAFRKNPADAEAVLAAARKKMPIFQSGFSDSEEVEKDAEDADDGERDEDSEWDDLDVQDCSAETKSNMHVLNSNKFKGFMVDNLVNNGKKEVLCDTSVLTSQRSSRDINKGFQIDTAVYSNQGIISSAVPSGKIGSNYNVERKTDVEDVEIDESNFGELWVQGLTEGDYTDLSVEERLNALVALTGVALEGNSIRGILEERLEAATALKKQMWAEVQLDKRRYKEDYLNKSQPTALSVFESEAAQSIVGAHGYQTPLQLPHAKSSDDNSEVVSNDKFPTLHSLHNIDVVPSERIILGQELSTNPESCSLQQYGATEKSRFQLKSYIGHKAEQLYVYRSLPLGEDRRKNKYWLFSTSASPNDPGSGRIFFESRDGFWRLIDSIETFDALLASLDTRGIRESHLYSMLQRIETNFKEAVRRNNKCSTSSNTSEFPFKRGVVELISTPDFLTKYESLSSPLRGLTSNTTEYSTSFSVDLGQSETERTAALNRYRGFVKWMWKECCNPHNLFAMRYGKRRSSELLQVCQFCFRSYFTEERHCTSCHGTFKSIYNGDAMFTKHIAACALKRKVSIDFESQMPDSSLTVGACLLKTQLSLIEASIPPEALQPFWTEGYRKSWGVKLNLASSPDEFLQLLTLLEGAVKQEYLSSKFETTTELLTSAKANNALTSGSVPVLPWIPDSTAAVSLRLLELDASISYVSLPKLEPQKERDSEDLMKLSPRFMIVKAGTSEQADSQTEGRSLVPGSRFRGRGRGSTRGFGRRGRGRRGRGRGGRGSRENGLVREIEEEMFDKSENTSRKYGRRGRVRGRGGRFGRRSVRPRQSSESHAEAPRTTFFAGSHDTGARNKEDSAEESSRSSAGGGDWGIEARSYMKEDIGFASNSDGNGRASGDEYIDQLPKYARRCDEAESMVAMEEDSEDEADEGSEEEEEEDDDGEVAFDDVDAAINDQDEETDVDEEMADDDDEIGPDDLSDGEDGFGDEDDEGSYSSSE